MKRVVVLGFALALITHAAPSVDAQGNTLSFFITSVGSGKGADLGGLAGADAHCQALAKAVNAKDRVKGRGDTPNQHDILTGTNLDGTVSGATCNNWTSSAADSTATVGHFDRQGGGTNPTSWHSAHASKGCSLDQLRGSGGEAYFYCFAAK